MANLPKFKALNAFGQVCNVHELVAERRRIKLLVPAWGEQYWCTIRIYPPAEGDDRGLAVLRFNTALLDDDRHRRQWEDLCASLFVGKHDLMLAHMVV